MGNLAPNKVSECIEHCGDLQCSHEHIQWSEGGLIHSNPPLVTTICGTSETELSCNCHKFIEKLTCLGGDSCLCDKSHVNTIRTKIVYQTDQIILTLNDLVDLDLAVIRGIQEGTLMMNHSENFIVKERISTDVIKNCFSYWIENHPIYRDLYSQKDCETQLENADFYNTHIMVNIFSKFLDGITEDDRDVPRILTFLAEDGSCYRIHFLTSRQQETFQTKWNFIFRSNFSRNCRVAKFVAKERLNYTRIQSKFYCIHSSCFKRSFSNKHYLV
jgi:hypothetical protein